MAQMARNAVDESGGSLRHIRFVMHDRDTKFCASFRAILTSGGIVPLGVAAAQSESKHIRRTVGTIDQERVPVQAHSVRRGLAPAGGHSYLEHYHHERNHQGKGNLLLFPGGHSKPA